MRYHFGHIVDALRAGSLADRPTEYRQPGAPSPKEAAAVPLVAPESRPVVAAA